MPRFNIGDYTKEKKRLREKLVMENRDLAILNDQINTTTVEKANKMKELNRIKAKCRRLDEKVGKVVEAIENLEEISDELSQPARNSMSYSLSDKGIGKMPTYSDDGTVAVCKSLARQRRKATFDAARKIHGGKEELSAPGAVGLIDTALAKSPKGILVKAMSSSKKFTKSVMPNIYKKKLKSYESSCENMVRSIAVYYSGGIAGKQKYRKIYKYSGYKVNSSGSKHIRLSIHNCPLPRLIPYNRLMPYIKTIPLGTIYSVADTLCDGLDECDRVQGCYRKLNEILVKLAEFYLSGSSNHSISWFGAPYTFVVALGGDGAPFGKDDTACAWLVSFLNIGRGVLSSNENFLLFGANCSENCIVVQRYLKILLADIYAIENETLTCSHNGKEVSIKFKIGELPNDMKMLSFLAGELGNSAKYFSSFANVSSENANDINGTFGVGSANTWKPWKYSDRLKVVKSVQQFKEKISKQSLSKATKRSKVTSFIAEKKSRQEFEPLLGQIIDRAHVDPLHLKNNACALAHRYLLTEVISHSNLSQKLFSEVPSISPFARYINAMRTKCHLSRLAKKIVRWFNDTGANGKIFDYRFTGKDSRLFLQNFMYLIDAVEPSSKASSRKQLIYHVLAYLCLTLRDCVSLFSRIQISHDQLQKLETHCMTYFILNCIYFQQHPTVWTLGHIVPAHAKDMKTKYQMGLGLNSMEGREAKHISISRYSNNTNYQSRWEQVFMHEFISLIWLREKGYNNIKPTTSGGLSYVPKRVSEPNYGDCGLNKDIECSGCRFCLHRLRVSIKDRVKEAGRKAGKTVH